MHTLVLFCKSYKNDFSRLIDLAESVLKYNLDGIPFFVSVPKEDFIFFEKKLHNLKVKLFKDEEILASNPSIDMCKYRELPGKIQQQIVKSEFWRVAPSPLYLCIDSDSFFIRGFKESDFIDQFGTPYTTISDAHQLLDQALDKKEFSVLNNYFREMKLVQELIDRSGRAYAFGPTPVVWHRDVWKSLDDNYLVPNRISILDAIIKAPYELCWYGEALLKYKSIPLLPVESFFKVYHYKWQYKSDHFEIPKFGFLQKMYLGVVCQSNWHNPKKNFLHHFFNRFKENQKTHDQDKK